jgi:hypothetical protein
MRVPILLGAFLLTTSLLSFAADQAIQANGPQVSSSATDNVSTTASAHRRSPQRRLFSRDLDGIQDENVCLMLRTYIVVREYRNSDVTRRDGEVTCQPAWKFQTRSAVGTVEDR